MLYSLRIPKGTIRIVTSNASIGVFLESEHADFITIFGNLDDKDANCNSGKRLLMCKFANIVFTIVKKNKNNTLGKQCSL